MVLLLAGLVAPIVELFDFWDPEGLADDTEFGVFAHLFIVCLVLVVSKLVSSAALVFSFREREIFHGEEEEELAESARGFIFVVPPLLSLPLRI